MRHKFSAPVHCTALHYWHPSETCLQSPFGLLAFRSIRSCRFFFSCVVVHRLRLPGPRLGDRFLPTGIVAAIAFDFESYVVVDPAAEQARGGRTDARRAREHDDDRDAAFRGRARVARERHPQINPYPQKIAASLSTPGRPGHHRTHSIGSRAGKGIDRPMSGGGGDGMQRQRDYYPAHGATRSFRPPKVNRPQIDRSTLDGASRRGPRRPGEGDKRIGVKRKRRKRTEGSTHAHDCAKGFGLCGIVVVRGVRTDGEYSLSRKINATVGLSTQTNVMYEMTKLLLIFY